MKLFIWSSQACRLYGFGTIIVAAESVEEARNVGFTQAENAILGYSDMHELKKSSYCYEDDKEEFNRKLEEVGKDLEKEPQIMETPAAVFISGSE